MKAVVIKVESFDEGVLFVGEDIYDALYDKEEKVFNLFRESNGKVNHKKLYRKDICRRIFEIHGKYGVFADVYKIPNTPNVEDILVLIGDKDNSNEIISDVKKFMKKLNDHRVKNRNGIKGREII